MGDRRPTVPEAQERDFRVRNATRALQKLKLIGLSASPGPQSRKVETQPRSELFLCQARHPTELRFRRILKLWITFRYTLPPCARK